MRKRVFVFLAVVFGLGLATLVIVLPASAHPAEWGNMTNVSNTTETLEGVWGANSSEVFAVGVSGTIVRYNGTAWINMTSVSNTSSHLHGVWGNSSSEIFAVGDSGTVVYWNGSAWVDKTSTSNTSNGLNGVWGTNFSDVFAVGQSGTIVRYNGTTWINMTSASNTTNHLRGVWGNSSSDVFAVGYSGTIVRYNGTAWINMTSASNTTSALEAVWGNSSSDVFAVGHSGTIVRYNGSAWLNMTSASGTTKNLQGVWGSSSTDVFAVGFSGTILHYNGTAWINMTDASGTTQNLFGVWGSSSTDVFAVGASGTILHYFEPPSATFDPTSGPVGTNITVTGTDWAASENITAVNISDVAAEYELSVDVNGNLSGNIIVPSLTGGSYNITITGNISLAQTFTNAFNVTTAATFNPTSGPVGTNITVTGTGWHATENITNVTFDSVPAASYTLNVDVSGNLSGNITVPALNHGIYNITITGNISDAQTFTDKFNVTTAATFTPDSGPVGTNITVTGTDWAASENITAVNISDVAAEYELSVDVSGNLSGNITVPALNHGIYNITITGNISDAQTFTDKFNATTAATFNPTSGPVGTNITVTGTDWVVSENISAVNVSDVAAEYELSVDVNGNLSGNIIVPTLTPDTYNITITGNISGQQIFTNAFTVTATANFTPDTGPVGTNITVTGTGWSASENISATNVTLDAVIATHNLSVNAAGNLSGNITVPTLNHGAYNITITGNISGAQTFPNAFNVTTAATFNPTSGPVGTNITVTGTDWVVTENISAVNVSDVTASHTLSVNGDGNLSGNIIVPLGAPLGAQNITITGNISGVQTFINAFTVTNATATFTPSSGPVGANITVTGTGWVANDTISPSNVTFDGTPASHTLSVNPSGNLSGNITVPTLDPATYNITITGNISGQQIFTNAFETGRVTNVNTGETYSTIQRAINYASAGDTIIVDDGEYHEQIFIDEKLTIVSANGSANTTINGSGLTDLYLNTSWDGGNITTVYPVVWIDAAEVVFGNATGGFNVTGATAINISDGDSPPSEMGVGLLNLAPNCTIEGNILDGNIYGILGWYAHGASYNQMLGNDFSDNVMAVYLTEGGGDSVKNSTFIDNVCAIILEGPWDGEPQNVEVLNNTL